MNTKNAIYLLTIVLLSGCTSQSVRYAEIDHIKDVIDDAIMTNENQHIVPEDVTAALIPAVNLNASQIQPAEEEQRLDISVNNTSVDQFFLSLVDGTEYNIVIHPKIKENITLNLKNVTIPEVLEVTRDVYGFEFVQTPYGFQVLPGRLKARIYQVNYLHVQRSGSSSTQISSGALTQSVSGSDDISSDDTGTSTSGSASSISGSEVRTEHPETSFWDELQKSIQAIIGEEEGRNVVVNPQSGVVVVRALPNELREVETFLSATQLIIQRQVVLEAKILEVTLNEGMQTGINWAGILTSGNSSITAANIGGGSVLVDRSGESRIAGNTGTLGPTSFSSIEGTTAGAFGGVFTMALQSSDFNAFIELLKTQGAVHVLSSPRIATLNNQKAIIKVGQDEFFVTDTSNTITTGTATTSTPTVKLTPFFSGIALDVTPQISQQGDVMLHVHPSISEVVDQQKTVTLGDEEQTLPLALSTIRESDSIVRARSGQVIVIGGLMQDIANDSVATNPILENIPLIKAAFKHQKNSSVKRELVILLRPVVVENGADWNAQLKSTSDSINNIKRSYK